MGFVSAKLGFVYNFLIMLILNVIYLALFAIYIPNQTKIEKET